MLVVEILSGRLTRVRPDGQKSVVAMTGGGPNGTNGRCHICNNGGFGPSASQEVLLPTEAPYDPPDSANDQRTLARNFKGKRTS